MRFAALDKEMSCIGMSTPAKDLIDHDAIEKMKREFEVFKKYRA